MALNDYCRLCKVNMRVGGIYGHSVDLFSTKKTPSLSERLVIQGVTVAQEPGQSSRCCQRCSSRLSRLERDMPAFRQWEEEFRNTDRNTDSNMSKRPREPTPSETPSALKKTCPSPPSPRTRSSRKTTTQTKFCSRQRRLLPKEPLSGCQQPAPADVPPSGTVAIMEEAGDESPDQSTQQSTGTSKQAASVRNAAFQADPLKTCTARTPLHLEAHLKNTQKSVFSKDVGVSTSTDSQTRQELKDGSPRDAEKSHDSTCESPDVRKETSGSHQKSYIVSESCLLELFEVCPVCKRVSDVRTRRLGAFLSVEQRCPRCQFSRKWNNQPVPGSHPAEDLQLSAAVYLTGSSFLKLEKILQAMQLKMFRSVQRDARLYVEPEIVHRWKSAQDGEFELQNLILGGDFREDAADVQQLLVIKEEAPWSSSLDQQDPEPVHVKEEEEEPWTSQESEMNGFTFTGEDDREAEPPTSSSGPEPARNPDPNSHLQPNTDEKALKVFETDVSIDDDDDDDAWQEPWSDPWSDSEPDSSDATPESDVFSDVCVEETTRSENLSRDGRAGTAEKRFICSICAKVFTRLVDLRRHRRVHPEDKPFDCDLCGKRFRMERALKAHMRIHTGEKPFSCDVCGRSFTHQYVLTAHKKIHSRERPFDLWSKIQHEEITNLSVA
ncbi:uncharacterized protein PAE49_000955 isoform 2-T2 [Odontesthes bonariensis]|uniref:uncharacterized protein LOC142374570 isoform X2 n=1 Tax=Odontesthes bonariensis TaxID=219752 RepID=UPI003F580BF2